MRKLFLVTILMMIIPKIGNTQEELESLKIKLELPISFSDSITSVSEIEKEPVHVLTYYLSPFYKQEYAREQLDSTDNRTKVQVKYSDKSGYLCDLLNDCDNVYYSGNEPKQILEINTFYSDQLKDYYIVLVPDKNTSLEDIQKMTKTFLKTENIGRIYFAYKNGANEVNYFHFDPNEKFNIHTNQFKIYEDWVEANFKIIYGEVFFIVD